MKKYNEEIANNEKVEFIHFSLDRADAAALKWAKKESFPWAHVLPKQHTKSGLKKYAKSFVPYYVLLSKDGKVVAEGKQATFQKAKTLTTS